MLVRKVEMGGLEEARGGEIRKKRQAGDSNGQLWGSEALGGWSPGKLELWSDGRDVRSFVCLLVR